MAPEEFHLFPKLPPELRDEIWSMAYVMETWYFVLVKFHSPQAEEINTLRPRISEACSEAHFAIKRLTKQPVSPPFGPPNRWGCIEGARMQTTVVFLHHNIYLPADISDTAIANSKELSLLADRCVHVAISADLLLHTKIIRVLAQRFRSLESLLVDTDGKYFSGLDLRKNSAVEIVDVILTDGDTSGAKRLRPRVAHRLVKHAYRGHKNPKVPSIYFASFCNEQYRPCFPGWGWAVNLHSEYQRVLKSSRRRYPDSDTDGSMCEDSDGSDTRDWDEPLSRHDETNDSEV